MHHRYRCSRFRKTGCKATLEADIQSGVLTLGDATHPCDYRVIQEADIVDTREGMKLRARERATHSYGITATKVWLAG